MTNIIQNTFLFERLIGKSCFDKKAMQKLFPYKRRKDFLMFLVENGHIPYQGTCLSNSYHKIFSKEDIHRTIMSFI